MATKPTSTEFQLLRTTAIYAGLSWSGIMALAYLIMIMWLFQCDQLHYAADSMRPVVNVVGPLVWAAVAFCAATSCQKSINRQLKNIMAGVRPDPAAAILRSINQGNQ
jgi:hypothetical protein